MVLTFCFICHLYNLKQTAFKFFNNHSLGLLSRKISLEKNADKTQKFKMKDLSIRMKIDKIKTGETHYSYDSNERSHTISASSALANKHSQVAVATGDVMNVNGSRLEGIKRICHFHQSAKR